MQLENLLTNFRLYLVLVALACFLLDLNFNKDEIHIFESYMRPIKAKSVEEEKEIYKIIERKKENSQHEKYWRIDKREKVQAKLEKQEARKMRKAAKNTTNNESAKLDPESITVRNEFWM